MPLIASIDSELAHQGLALLGLVLRDTSHDPEAVGVGLGGLQRVVDAVALPGRRHDDHAVDTGLVHQPQALLVEEGLLAVAVETDPLTRARDPGAVGRLLFPDMYLRIDDEHL